MRWFDANPTTNSQDLAVLGRILSVFDPCEILKSVESTVNLFQYIFFKTTQNIFLGPKIVICGSLMKNLQGTAEIWRF